MSQSESLPALQAFKPIPISEVAKKLGLSPEDYDLYGTTKAKARRPSGIVPPRKLLAYAEDSWPHLARAGSRGACLT